MAYSEVDNECFIVQLDTLDRLGIQFLPDSIEWGVSSQDRDMIVIGRNNPFINHSSNQDQLRMTLDFYNEEEGGLDVMRKVRWLKSLAYPDGNKPKSKVGIVFGDLFEREKWEVREAVPDLRILRKGQGYMPRYASVNLLFVLDPDKNITHGDIRL